jgi:magnesium transporter
MKFEINKESLDNLNTLVEHGKDHVIREMLEDSHPADLAELFEELRYEKAQYVYKLLESEVAAEVLMHLEEDTREKFLKFYTSQEIADELIQNIDSDDAADLLGELSDEKQEEVIALLGNEDHATDIIELLNYEEGTAGALMATELVWVNKNWTVGTCIREMRKQAAELRKIYTIYVVDDKEVLLGRLSLKDLLFSASSSRTQVSDLFEEEDMLTVMPDEPEEEVARIMEKYDLVTIPVVNDMGVLLGRITIDDIVDVIVEEAEKDYQMASGISEDVEARDSIFALTRARLPWLVIGMAGGMLGAIVIGAFEIEKQAKMALFIPMIAAMGGNVGVQSAAIVVQGLANKSLKNENMVKRLLKELGVGMLNGLICSIILFAASSLLHFDHALCLTVSTALLAVIVFAALFGTFVPLTLDKYKIDPAVATGPFVTTVNDVVGLLIYFYVGKLFMAYLGIETLAALIPRYF